MGDVLDFRRHDAKARQGRVPSLDGSPAQIVFFTGVRYQREADIAVTLPRLCPDDGSNRPDGTAPGPRARKRRA